MSGLTGLVDVLLAERLSQRADLPRLPTAAVVAGPGPAVGGGALANDVRLASDAGVDGRAAWGAAPPQAAAEPAAEQPVAVLSVAGRAISRVLADLGVDAGPVPGTAPLAPQRPSYASGPLAAALADAVAASGLCYESHLAAFAAGQATRALLEREPQARWQRAARDRGAWSEDGGAPESPEAVDDRPAGGAVPPRALALVHQQLELLASGMFRWRGEAWPGVPLEWELAADRAPRDRQAPADEAPPASWSSTLALELPRLGAVVVRVSLNGTGVSAGVQALPEAVGPLRAGAVDLRERLERAGLQLPQLAIDGRGTP